MPLRVLGQVSTDETTIKDYVNNPLFKERKNISEFAASGTEALYQLLTKEGVKWRSDTDSETWTSLSFPAMDSDRWGGAGFRKNTLPIIFHIAKFYAHDKPFGYNTSIEDWLSYKDGYIDMILYKKS